eukprot:111134_1
MANIDGVDAFISQIDTLTSQIQGLQKAKTSQDTSISDIQQTMTSQDATTSDIQDAISFIQDEMLQSNTADISDTKKDFCYCSQIFIDDPPQCSGDDR